jgi:hypothetical protein
VIACCSERLLVGSLRYVFETSIRIARVAVTATLRSPGSSTIYDKLYCAEPSRSPLQLLDLAYLRWHGCISHEETFGFDREPNLDVFARIMSPDDTHRPLDALGPNRYVEMGCSAAYFDRNFYPLGLPLLFLRNALPSLRTLYKSRRPVVMGAVSRFEKDTEVQPCSHPGNMP